jgi:hypothetical protein
MSKKQSNPEPHPSRKPPPPVRDDWRLPEGRGASVDNLQQMRQAREDQGRLDSRIYLKAGIVALIFLKGFIWGSLIG